MTESTSEQPLIPQTPAPDKPAPKGKMPSTIAFAVGILLFFMPFVDIQCNNMSLQKVSGAELATGFKIKSPGASNSLFDNLNKDGDTKPALTKNDQKDPNVYALAALALGAFGLLLSFSNAKAGGIGGLLTGALSAAALIGLLIDIKQQLKADLSFKSDDTGISLAVEFTPWFYLSVVAFIAAAYFSYKRMKT